MKVFVAGATGVLGRPTVRALVEDGHAVRGTARGPEKADLLRSLGAEPVEVDLFDPDALRAGIAGSEGVLHFATKIPPIMRMRWKGAWRENDRLRTLASRHLVDAAINSGAQVFVYESITFIYGEHGDGRRSKARLMPRVRQNALRKEAAGAYRSVTPPSTLPTPSPRWIRSAWPGGEYFRSPATARTSSPQSTSTMARLPPSPHSKRRPGSIT